VHRVQRLLCAGLALPNILKHGKTKKTGIGVKKILNFNIMIQHRNNTAAHQETQARAWVPAVASREFALVIAVTAVNVSAIVHLHMEDA